MVYDMVWNYLLAWRTASCIAVLFLLSFMCRSTSFSKKIGTQCVHKYFPNVLEWLTILLWSIIFLSSELIDLSNNKQLVNLLSTLTSLWFIELWGSLEWLCYLGHLCKFCSLTFCFTRYLISSICPCSTARCKAVRPLHK